MLSFQYSNYNFLRGSAHPSR